MILIDFSAIAIGPIASGFIKGEDVNIVRHFILNEIRMYRSKFKEQYGEVIIVCDAGGNWRRDIYPEYKGKRTKSREESKVDWDEAYKSINTVIDEIETELPYKVIRVKGCEADDSIAELCKYTQEFGCSEEVVIVSSDKDFRQLQRYSNVKQYSTYTKKMIIEENPRLFQNIHFLVGDRGDGVPNVLSADKVFVEDRRQNTLSAKKKEALLADPKALGEEVYIKYLRNKTMINLMEDTLMPKEISKNIIDTFEKQDKNHLKGNVLNYLMKNNMRLLIECLDEFV